MRARDCLRDKLPQHFAEIFDCYRRIVRDVVKCVTNLHQTTTDHARRKQNEKNTVTCLNLQENYQWFCSLYKPENVAW